MNRKNRSFLKQLVQTAGLVAVCATANAAWAEETPPLQRPAAGDLVILRGLLALQYPSLVLSNSMPAAVVRPVETQIYVSDVSARERN